MANLKKNLALIDNRSLVDKVELRILEFFIKEKLKPGDLLPKEIEFAEALGVSRTVIRESMNRLKTSGIIGSKKHIGSVIKSPELFTILQKSMIPSILDNATLKDIFELRLLLEIGMADLIFDKITHEDIDQLMDIVEDEPEKSVDVFFDVKHEIKFHGELYRITGNKSLMQFQNLLLQIFYYIYQTGKINKKIKQIHYVSHKGLVEILKNGTPEKFIIAMRRHLINHFLRILDRPIIIK